MDERQVFDSFVRRTVLSPLRYPGGKRRLVPYVAAALAANDLKPDLLVEPYAGGASMALELAHTGFVDRVMLGDADPMIVALWQTVFEDADWLCEQVAAVPLDLATWERFKRGRYRSRRSLALACLYLNRTSFNGALHRRAGPIGGKAQASEYDLGCRFPRGRLIKRIRACAALADRIVGVHAQDAHWTIRQARERARQERWSVFFYLDPPFWAKAEFLYRRSFTPMDHDALADMLHFVADPFLLSYDANPEIVERYRGHRAATVAEVELLYSGGHARSAGRELVISNLARLPMETRLWRPSSVRSDVRSTAQSAS
jgi:DNA adenine methylase